MNRMDIGAPNPAIGPAVPPGTEHADARAAYQQDERWLLVQRVLASPGFQRAGQLRRILKYITRAALLHPDVALHEYEIACEVLERRANFDPATDNIVRSQMSQLRRRLDVYFTEHGATEPLRIVIAKGSYLPQFLHVVQTPPAQIMPVIEAEAPTLLATALPRATPWWRGHTVAISAVISAIALIGLVVWGWSELQQRRSLAANKGDQAGAFVHFLQVRGPHVTVVLPDASLMLVQKELNSTLTSQEYSNGSALESRIAASRDPIMRDFLEAIRGRRLTTMNEAMIAEDLKDVLARQGVTATIRFARDMHTHDFGEGNLILIGSRRSNPWTELFASQTNFRFTEDADRQFVYRNTAPARGEPALYKPYQEHEGKLSSYADVAFTANLTHSGYVLLINGSDYAANEAAARYLLHGHLRDDLSSVLHQDDLAYFEILLSGSRADNDAEESFDLVAVRPLKQGQ